MSDCRDWLSTLWPASFRGFQFFFESDDEEGGRGLVIHEFPHRDAPYIEDLGESPRVFSGSAYVHGDNADRLAVQFADGLASRGPATLVVPVRGPVLVHAQSFRRRHERDRLGYVAFEVKFVRDGAATALVSVPFLGNLAYAAAESMASALSAHVASALALDGRPDYVIEAASDGTAFVAAAVDTLRETYPVAPAASARLRDTLAGLIETAPDAMAAGAGMAAVEAFAGSMIAVIRDLSDAIAPADTAAGAMLALAETFAVRATAQAYPSPLTAQAAGNAAEIDRLARLAALTAFAEATIRRSYRSRPDGVSARAEIAARFEAELLNTTGAANAALYVAIVNLQGRVIEYLSRLINDLAPVVTVEAARQMPSLFWAWRLYADPQRAGELVARNSVRHPSFMPATFAALAR